MLDVKSDPPPTLDQTAGYIREMALELRQLAEARGLDFLAYLLALAADEAGAGDEGRSNRSGGRG